MANRIRSILALVVLPIRCRAPACALLGGTGTVKLRFGCQRFLPHQRGGNVGRDPVRGAEASRFWNQYDVRADHPRVHERGVPFIGVFVQGCVGRQPVRHFRICGSAEPRQEVPQRVQLPAGRCQPAVQHFARGRNWHRPLKGGLRRRWADR